MNEITLSWIVYCQNCGGMDGETYAQNWQRDLVQLSKDDIALYAGLPPYTVSQTDRGCLCQHCHCLQTVRRMYDSLTGEPIPMK
jgi:hypothetical protein